jgi:hypothetical protein
MHCLQGYRRRLKNMQSRLIEWLQTTPSSWVTITVLLGHIITILSARKLYSSVLLLLETHVTPPDTEPGASFIILDGSALINALPSRISKTFEEYAVLEVIPKVRTYSCTYTRTYIVFDVCWSCLGLSFFGEWNQSCSSWLVDKINTPVYLILSWTHWIEF